MDLGQPVARHGNLERARALPRVEVAACPEGNGVNRGGPPVRRPPGRLNSSAVPYKARPKSGPEQRESELGTVPVARRTTPPAVGKVQHYLAAKRSPRWRFHALYDRIAWRDVLARAWDQVRANRGAGGVDGETIAEVEAYGVGPDAR